jgi:dihydrofolate reductase
MRKLVVNEFMTLDGVVQAPGGAEEDTDGGFEHGGWHLRYFNEHSNERSQRWVLDSILGAGGFVLGRRTWEIFAGYWPNASEDERVIADPLNSKPKYVASRTLNEPLAWQNSHLVRDADAIAALKREDGDDLHVIGSADLVQSLIAANVVDEYRLMIDPLLVGKGKQLFRGTTGFRPLRLVDGVVTDTGVILAAYEPADR